MAKTKTETVEKQTVTITVEEMGPNSIVMGQHVADFGPVTLGKKKFTGDVMLGMGGQVVVYLRDDDTYPSGPLKFRRVVFSLRALVGAALDHIEKNPVPKGVTFKGNWSNGKEPKIGRTF